MHSSRICHEFDGHNRKIHTVKGFVLEKPRIAMDFYSREHVVALLKIKTFTGKLWKHVERRVLLWTRGRAHGSRKINDGKPPFRVTAAFISLSLSLFIVLSLFASPSRLFVRSSKGAEFISRISLSASIWKGISRTRRNIQSTFNCCRMETRRDSN